MLLTTAAPVAASEAMHEIPRHVVWALPAIGGVDLSITNYVLMLWGAAALTGGLLLAAFRRRAHAPAGGLSTFFEALTDFVERQIVGETLGAAAPRWAPFLLTLFFLVLFGNLIGMLPAPHHLLAATGNLSVTVGLALVVFAVTMAVAVRRHGWLGFLKRFAPVGVPRWLLPFVVPIEIVSWLAKPVSLALRLFANMLAGHALILVFVGLAAAAAWYLKPLPLAGALIMSVFELFVCFVQAFIFTMLAGVYLREALDDHGA